MASIVPFIRALEKLTRLL